MLALRLISLPCVAGDTKQSFSPEVFQVANLDDRVLPPGVACWQATGSQDGAQSLLLPGTGLTFPAANVDLVRARHALAQVPTLCPGWQGWPTDMRQICSQGPAPVRKLMLPATASICS